MKCWCGEPRPKFAWAYVEASCNGLGYRHCFCGGDFCCCHLHGGTECEGCENCDTPEDDDDPPPAAPGGTTKGSA